MFGYLHSNERPKQARSAAGPGYTLTHPACLSELSANPPQSTPMVAMPAFQVEYTPAIFGRCQRMLVDRHP
jgi:hypothetical protein